MQMRGANLVRALAATALLAPLLAFAQGTVQYLSGTASGFSAPTARWRARRDL